MSFWEELERTYEEIRKNNGQIIRVNVATLALLYTFVFWLSPTEEMAIGAGGMNGIVEAIVTYDIWCLMFSLIFNGLSLIHPKLYMLFGWVSWLLFIFGMAMTLLLAIIVFALYRSFPEFFINKIIQLSGTT